MANKRYSENDNEAGGKASLEGQVKGKAWEPDAKFGPLTHPKGSAGAEGGAGDDENFGGFGKVTVKVEKPEDKEKHLPKAGGLA